ncbi:MAG: transposase [Phycisphaerae bacterium]|nr:transposase [Phycisphaerae bacterium]
MPRTARIAIPDVPVHITQRGNNRQDVFFVDDDRRVYLSILREQSELYGLEVLGWCLMTNHIHLITRPKAADSLAKALGRTHYRYTQYVNRLHGRSGHLWQNRFFSCPLGREHFWQALRYVEQNPLRSGLVRQAWKYPWSSAAAHIEGRDDTGLLHLAYWRQIASAVDWRKALETPQADEQIERIRIHTHTGRPLASDSLISKLEKLVNKRLRPLPVGRPKKEIQQKEKNR